MVSLEKRPRKLRQKKEVDGARAAWMQAHILIHEASHPLDDSVLLL